MKNISLLSVCGLVSILLFGVLSAKEAAAQEFTCKRRASLDNYHVYIRDLDRDGNPTGNILFKGGLISGDSLTLAGRSGRISHAFGADSGCRDCGSNGEVCRNNRILGLPR